MAKTNCEAPRPKANVRWQKAKGDAKGAVTKNDCTRRKNIRTEEEEKKEEEEEDEAKVAFVVFCTRWQRPKVMATAKREGDDGDGRNSDADVRHCEVNVVASTCEM